MHEDPILEALVHALLFFALSDSAIIDEDAAVGVLEQIAATLQRLAPAEKARFLTYVNDLAVLPEYRKARTTLESLAETMGLSGTPSD